MRRVMYNVNGTLTPSYADAVANGTPKIVLENVVEPVNEFIPKCGKVKPKAVKPR